MLEADLKKESNLEVSAWNVSQFLFCWCDSEAHIDRAPYMLVIERRDILKVYKIVNRNMPTLGGDYIAIWAVMPGNFRDFRKILS